MKSVFPAAAARLVIRISPKGRNRSFLNRIPLEIRRLSLLTSYETDLKYAAHHPQSAAPTTRMKNHAFGKNRIVTSTAIAQTNDEILKNTALFFIIITYYILHTLWYFMQIAKSELIFLTN